MPAGGSAGAAWRHCFMYQPHQMLHLDRGGDSYIPLSSIVRQYLVDWHPPPTQVSLHLFVSLFHPRQRSNLQHQQQQRQRQGKSSRGCMPGVGTVGTISRQVEPDRGNGALQQASGREASGHSRLPDFSIFRRQLGMPPGQAEKLVALAPVVLLQMLSLHRNQQQWVRSAHRQAAEETSPASASAAAGAALEQAVTEVPPSCRAMPAAAAPWLLPTSISARQNSLCEPAKWQAWTFDPISCISCW